MSEQAYEIGRRYWLDNGAEVILQARTDDGQFVVAPVLIVTSYRMSYDGPDEYDHEEPGPAFLAQTLNSKAPVEKKDAEVAEIDQRISAKRKDLEAIDAEIRRVTSERDQIMKRLSDVPALRHLDDIIAGRFTHVVFESHDYIVQTAEQAMKASSRDDDYQWRKQPWRLLTLFGKTGGDLQWRINDWKDGSGSNRDVRLFTSEEEAVAYAIEKTSAKFDAVRADIAAGKHPWNVEALLKDARSLGIRPPADIAEWQQANARAVLAGSIQKKREEIAQAEAAIAALAEPSA